jgi:hypothetical protein
MLFDPEQEPRHAGEAVLSAHHRDEGQHFLKHLVGAARRMSRAELVGGVGFNHPARRHCLRGVVLARRLRGANDVTGPKEGENLPIAILEQPNGADDPLPNLDVLPLLLALPEKRAAAWDAGDNLAAPLRKNFTLTRKLDRERQNVASPGRRDGC